MCRLAAEAEAFAAEDAAAAAAAAAKVEEMAHLAESAGDCLPPSAALRRRFLTPPLCDIAETAATSAGAEHPQNGMVTKGSLLMVLCVIAVAAAEQAPGLSRQEEAAERAVKATAMVKVSVRTLPLVGMAGGLGAVQQQNAGWPQGAAAGQCTAGRRSALASR